MREFGKKRIAGRKSDLWQQADETAEKSAAHFPNGTALPRDLILAQRQKNQLKMRRVCRRANFPADFFRTSRRENAGSRQVIF